MQCRNRSLAPIMSSPDTQELFDDVLGLYDEAPVPPPPPPSPWQDSRLRSEELSNRKRAKSNRRYESKKAVKKAIKQFTRERQSLAVVAAGSEERSRPISWAAEVDGLQRWKQAQTDRLSEAERKDRFARRKVYWVKEVYRLAKQEAKSSEDALREWRLLCSAARSQNAALHRCLNGCQHRV
jgi:hypothetical protein